MQQQQRFIVALVASAAVLILWNYFFPAIKPPQPNANANNQPSAQGSPQAGAQPTSSATATPPPAQAVASPLENNPQRKLKIVTPLYDATLDTHGAVVTSWIVKKNKNTGRDIYAASSTKNNPKPLELIPSQPVDISADQMFHPLQVVIGDPTIDGTLANRNYRVSGPNTDQGDETINVPTGSQQIEFVIHDDATGLDATKRVTFYADRYTADVELKILRNKQSLPAKLAIGPSIGDQGIEHFSFYSVAPEGFAVVDGKAQRFPADPIHRNPSGWCSAARPEGPDLQKVSGNVNWAGVGDTYFGMIAVLPQPLTGLEYRTVAYEQKTNGKAEQRFLITGLVPVPTDGSKIELYVG